MKLVPTRLLKHAARRLGVDVNVSRYRGPHIDERVVSLSPDSGPAVGHVLMSYIIEPFLRPPGTPISVAHTHDWESFEMARIFLRLGYSVDVISYRNTTFVPQRHYDLLVAARTDFDRLASLLNPDCVKIAHQDTAHWLFNNQAAYTRMLDLHRRRGMVVDSIRIIEHNRAMENADCATVLGNRFTMGTYEYAGKPIHRVPISTTVLYDWPEHKDFEACRNNFLWFGSGGFVHKGLDLVLEAFAEMPDMHLNVCGPIDRDREFKAAYARELFHTPNIHTHDWVDVAGKTFAQITADCAALVYPSCSEGGGGSAVTCMHAGLIPIVTHETSVDVGDFGVTIRRATVEGIKEEVSRVSRMSAAECRQRARAAWEHARANHTRDGFSEAFTRVAGEVLPPAH